MKRDLPMNFSNNGFLSTSSFVKESPLHDLLYEEELPYKQELYELFLVYLRAYKQKSYQRASFEEKKNCIQRALRWKKNIYELFFKKTFFDVF